MEVLAVLLDAPVAALASLRREQGGYQGWDFLNCIASLLPGSLMALASSFNSSQTGPPLP